MLLIFLFLFIFIARLSDALDAGRRLGSRITAPLARAPKHRNIGPQKGARLRPAPYRLDPTRVSIGDRALPAVERLAIVRDRGTQDSPEQGKSAAGAHSGPQRC